MQLTKDQREAANCLDKSVFVHAGPGSGKTRILISRIVNLVRSKVSPTEILAFTFTRAAAREMRERVTAELGEKAARDMWIMTIHAFCMRVISTWGWRAGYKEGVSIYDDRDQLDIIRGVQKDLSIKTKPETFLKEINRGKIHANRAVAFEEFNFRLRENNAINYIGLLDKAIWILANCADAKEHYAHKFRYVHLDEMNDTSDRDYSIVSMVASKWKNVFCVGDLSQTIFSFRGSNSANIDHLMAQFPDHEEFFLRKSFRCPAAVIDACNNLLPENNLEADRSGGLVSVREFNSEDEEAHFIAGSIKTMVETDGHKYSDFAILGRTHAVNEGIFNALRVNGVPTCVAGTKLKFYDQEEVRQFHDYLKIMANGRDDFSFRRIVNVPPRGIRHVTLARISAQAREAEISLLESALVHFSDEPVEERRWLAELGALAKGSFADQIRSVHHLLVKWYEDQGLKTRVKSLNKLLGLIATWQKETEEIVSVESYLRMLSEVNSQDDIVEDKDEVKLMTVHTSKGLEFPNVIIPACENLMFPMNNKADTPEKLEALGEERRLFYVALSRAKSTVTATLSKLRVVRGRDREQSPSVFLKEAGIGSSVPQNEDHNI
ncbi:hypothetical protein LCGC14_0430530 [marine sediment metagenome]|uniref:DNA 3'-5' helicase n=1 Tax=marine sediment metagenome TaxID=412755 RepID=A0A0F9SN67_9ZZZZ